MLESEEREPGAAALDACAASVQTTVPAGGGSLRWLVRGAWELASTLIPALLLALALNVYVAEAVEVRQGPSMQPNLYVGYRVMTEKISYRFHTPHRGDVVVADRTNDVTLIKRVIGLPGETVEVRDGHALINGEPIAEPWVTYFGGPSYGPAVVPSGMVFIMGDNRANSRDSRSIGPVEIKSLEGRAWLIYWPLNHLRFLP